MQPYVWVTWPVTTSQKGVGADEHTLALALEDERAKADYLLTTHITTYKSNLATEQGVDLRTRRIQ